MPDNEGFVHDFLLADSNTRRFHAGDACQWSPPIEGNEVEPQVASMIAAHRAEIHAPGSRVMGQFGLDEEGNPIETSYLGVGVDPETGALVPLDKDGNPRADSPSAAKAKAAKGEEPRRSVAERDRPAAAGGPLHASGPVRTTDKS